MFPIKSQVDWTKKIGTQKLTSISYVSQLEYVRVGPLNALIALKKKFVTQLVTCSLTYVSFSQIG